MTFLALIAAEKTGKVFIKIKKDDG